MGDLEAIDIIESVDGDDQSSVIEAWQALINSGTVWQLQGFYGRTARQLILQGLCSQPEQEED